MTWFINHRLIDKALKIRSIRESEGEKVNSPQLNDYLLTGTSFAFDLDSYSLKCMKESLPQTKFIQIDGATASSLSMEWNPAVANLILLNVSKNSTDFLSLCRFLTFCSSYSKDFRHRKDHGLVEFNLRKYQDPRIDAPLIVLLPPRHEHLVRTAFDAGAHGCIIRPMNQKELTALLPHFFLEVPNIQVTLPLRYQSAAR